MADVQQAFFSFIDEKTTTSHVATATFVTWTKMAIQQINQEEILADYTTIAAVSGQRNYSLPASFYREIAIFYKGLPMQKAAPNQWNFYTSNTTGFSSSYTIIPYPQDSTNTKLTVGIPVLLVDPPPDATGTGNPTFPGPSDAYFSIFYFVRIPTNFTATSNFSTYTFNAPDEMFNLIAAKAAQISFTVDGNQEKVASLQPLIVGVTKALQTWRNWSADTSPSRIALVDSQYGFPFSYGGY